MSNQVICSDGDWVIEAGNMVSCSGTITQIVYTAPVEYTSEMAMEAIFQGFMVALPVMAVVFGGRMVLSMLK